MKELGNFVGVEPQASFDVRFEELRALDPKRFSIGNNITGIEEIERNHSDIFWDRHKKIMLQCGYNR